VTDRTVRVHWTGGLRAVADIDGFEVVADEPESSGGGGTGPQPTDLLLASVASCMAMSLAFVARKRGIDLAGLEVRVVGRYDGLKFDRISVLISSDTSAEVLQGLLGEAERVCYVSNTLRHRPELDVAILGIG
jgi:putative redox protein